MKLTSSACRAANHAYNLHTSVAGKLGSAEKFAGYDRQADGRSGLASGRSALAQVHQSTPGERASNGRTDAVHNDGATRARCRDARTNLGSDALGRRDDRFDSHGAGALTRASAFPVSPSIATIVRNALRAAVNASTDAAALDTVAEAFQTIAALSLAEVRNA